MFETDGDDDGDLDDVLLGDELGSTALGVDEGTKDGLELGAELGPALGIDEETSLGAADGIVEGIEDGLLLFNTLGSALTDGRLLGLIIGIELGMLVIDGNDDGGWDNSLLGVKVGVTLGSIDGAVVGKAVGEASLGFNTSPNISSTSIRCEELKLAKFGQTSFILLSLIPSHDAIPRNGASHEVVGIIRPIHMNKQKRDITITKCQSLRDIQCLHVVPGNWSHLLQALKDLHQSGHPGIVLRSYHPSLIHL